MRRRSLEYARAKVDVDLIRFAERASVLALDGGSVRFHHQLIQEYFAAVAIADQPLERERIRSATWREVIVALAGIKDDPDQVVDVIRDADHRLAARCLIEGVAAEDATVGRVANDLIRELESLAARAEEKRAADVRYRQQNPGMSWSSTQMMEDALDHHFGHPEVEMAEIRQLLKNLGPQAHASIALAAVADGPAGPDLRAIVREPAGRR